MVYRRHSGQDSFDNVLGSAEALEDANTAVGFSRPFEGNVASFVEHSVLLAVAIAAVVGEGQVVVEDFVFHDSIIARFDVFRKGANRTIRFG